MSLVNDALKRASEAQGNEQPGASPKFKFRGVEPAQRHPGETPWFLGSLMFVAILIAALFYWESARRRANGKIESDPRASSGKQTGSLANEMKVRAREDERLPGAPLITAKPVESTQAETVAVVAVSGTTVQETPKQEPTNSVAAAAEPAKPPAPKLQAIVYNPASPSAIISGKTVFTGDRVGEWSVASVGRDYAMLVKEGETNVLKLGE